MRITYQHRFSAPIDRVVAMLRSEDAAVARSRAAGASNADVMVDLGEDGAFTLSIRRTVPSREIPAEFRALVGNELSVRYTEAWDAPNADVVGREGTFALEIPGTPGHARGSLVITPDGQGTAFGLAGEVSAPVPLVGPMIEKAVADAVASFLPRELSAADAWLAEHA